MLLQVWGICQNIPRIYYFLMRREELFKHTTLAYDNVIYYRADALNVIPEWRNVNITRRAFASPSAFSICVCVFELAKMHVETHKAGNKKQRRNGKESKQLWYPETVKLMIGWQQAKDNDITEEISINFCFIDTNERVDEQHHSLHLRSRPASGFSNGLTWRMSVDNELAKRQQTQKEAAGSTTQS